MLKGVTIEFHNPSAASNGLTRLAKWLTPQRSKRIELRKVNLLAGTERLEAGRVRFLADGKWELLDGAAFISGTNSIHASCGTFQSTGEQAGEVVLQGTPPSTNRFLIFQAHPPTPGTIKIE